nr:unnamed protein product [Digitaria exilis]
MQVAAAAAGGHAAEAAGGEDAMVRPAAEGGGEAQVGSTLCCSNTTAYHECVVACFDYYPRQQAEKICDPGCQEAYQCRVVSGDKCPTGGYHDPSSDDLPIADDHSAAGEARAVTTTLCCSNMTGFQECVHDCFAYFPREQAEKICDPGCKEAYQCRTVSGDKCPSGHLTNSVDFLTYKKKKLTSLFVAAEGNASLEKCLSGCRSSVCNKMVTGVGSKRVEAVKHAIGRCNNACYNFCTKGLSAGTATA